jgi:hypothetical protein
MTIADVQSQYSGLIRIHERPKTRKPPDLPRRVVRFTEQTPRCNIGNTNLITRNLPASTT